ncbi:hypothetical protein BBD42_24970 [Paenibacillus sp. BIHB 4019]|uniref:Butirosin biosynthesis protein H N-terminal domain-containing protein n=1 Tax=Paenibacillus sp. BIHB 4019 TaxID=1870819 RepID=A0A1B2DNT8_9BACL|nr:hypothetical protein [Paenibacillus sp. BIHB 4019]ANY69373.1 hypothetical protein BBD42_24970 [Paenibacillus sp. BIHB 4019]
MVAKVLPMQYPDVTSWQWHANLLAVLSNYPQSTPWIMSNYIQLQMTFDPTASQIEFYRAPTVEFGTFPHLSPWIYQQLLKRETVRLIADDPVTFFCGCIDRGNYIYTVVEQSVFLDGIDHFQHDTFIYGYDMDEEVFYVADFTFKGKYSFEKVSFAQLRMAYEAVNDEWDWLMGGRGGVALFSFRDARYEFNIELVRRLIQEFLACSSSFSLGSDRRCAFGLDVYEALAEDAIKAAAGEWEPDYKPFHVIYDHKKLMLKRIEYMGQYGYLNHYEELYGEYEIIANLAFLARNLVVKARVAGNREFMKKAGTLLGEISDREKKTLTTMLRML